MDRLTDLQLERVIWTKTAVEVSRRRKTGTKLNNRGYSANCEFNLHINYTSSSSLWTHSGQLHICYACRSSRASSHRCFAKHVVAILGQQHRLLSINDDANGRRTRNSCM